MLKSLDGFVFMFVYFQVWNAPPMDIFSTPMNLLFLSAALIT